MIDMSFLGVNTEDIQTNDDPIPEGEYTLVAVDAELKDTKAGTGKYLNVSFQIADNGPYKGRMFFEIINVQNPNPKAVEIGLQTLGKLCKAVGHQGPISDSSVFMNKPFIGKVKVTPDNGYGPGNKVASFKPLRTQPVQQPQMVQQQAQQVQQQPITQPPKQTPAGFNPDDDVPF